MITGDQEEKGGLVMANGSGVWVDEEDVIDGNGELMKKMVNVKSVIMEVSVLVAGGLVLEVEEV